MEYLLIQVLKKDRYGNKIELQRIYRYTQLLMDPQVNMNIRLEVDEIFYVEYIRQDLKNKRVILYEYKDLNHSMFHNEDFWKAYLMAKIALGWKKVPKEWKFN